MNDINLLYVAVDAAAVTLQMILAFQLIRKSPNYLVALLVGLMCVGVISYIVSSRDDYGMLIDTPFRLDLGSLHPLFNLLRNSISGAFMLLCHLIFRDRRSLPWVLIGLWVLQTFMEEPLHWIVGPDWATPPMRTLVFEAIPAVLQFTFVCLALYWVYASREADLIIARRQARVLILLVYATRAFLTLAVERVAFGFEWVPWDWQYPIHVSLIFLGIPFSAILIYAAASPQTAIVLGGIPDTPPKRGTQPMPKTEESDAARLRAIFEDEHFYRQPGLAIRDLAQHLSMPEYRLRSLIHEHMGYRNFNALLHRYRVAEVCEALEDPKQNATPVLTLALSAGYQSINPFNRAFRELKGTTPTNYRARSQSLVDSSNSTPDQ